MGITLPDKLYFKIGEVAKIAEVKPSVLRFWETEFVFLRPDKSLSGQRLYSRNEVELILQVKQLLYEDRFTIEGVKQKFSSKGKLKEGQGRFSKKAEVDPSTFYLDLLKDIKASLKIMQGKL